ncbi:RNA polymerase sigma factor [Herbiconiux ginsengi]|uniref:RNA polymerase sigma-70 factor, ECF subfamily n=1 Tax=Herbiconiux ginsengi TaxID=381665 RepID=A0A1H3SYQ2_9MICO|nr:sigma-70 family RNA polymerase sigma factor [Herbiconiux ginsengi]SDZ43112.1 RNA polymerase sigma-70 factor, ECF subfamily [Herbiconiux ginsengi]
MTTGALEVAFREEWPRILGSVLRFTGDLQLAEDAVQEAFARLVVLTATAATSAPGASGPDAATSAMPRNPASWITTTAKHVAVDWMRREAGFVRNFGRLAAEAADREAAAAEQAGADPFGVSIDDDRLQLLFMACHPELAEEARLAIALRAVCGVPTEEIAELFLVKQATMAARLTRAKKRIQSSGIRLEQPDATELAARTDDVLAIVYLLYTAGHTALAGDAISSAVTTESALSLARSMVRLRPRHLEARGLLALLLLTEARAHGRTDAAGEVVSLEDADRSLWNTAMIQEGLGQATIALAGRGRFALQAGISGLHSQAPTWEATDWVSIVSLYDALVASWPSPAARLNRLVARSFLPGADLGVSLGDLDEMTADSTPGGAAFARQVWAVRGDLLRRAARPIEAAHAYDRALEGESNDAVRSFLARRVREVQGKRIGPFGDK